MSGETERNISGWTTDTLKELVDSKLEALEADCKANLQVANERDVRYSQRFQAQQEALTAALSAAKEAVASALMAADRAVTKAELASEKRFESVNEFRGALSDQTSKLLPRIEAEQRFLAMEEKINRIDRIQSAGVGKGEGIGTAWQIILGVIAIIGTLAAVVYTIHAVTGK